MKILITLKPYERQALEQLAEAELREIRAQAEIIIRNELVRLGLLPKTYPDPSNDDGTLGKGPQNVN